MNRPRAHHALVVGDQWRRIAVIATIADFTASFTLPVDKCWVESHEVYCLKCGKATGMQAGKCTFPHFVEQIDCLYVFLSTWLYFTYGAYTL